MEKRVERAIDTFLEAITNGTLAKGTCEACAIGNLVAKEINYTPVMRQDLDSVDSFDSPSGKWGNLFTTTIDGQQHLWNTSEEQKEEAKRLLEMTEFTISELMEIENAFERNTRIIFYNYRNYTKEEIRKDQIKGLEAVVKVMLGFDKSNKEDVKEVFTSKAELIPV